MGIELWLDCWQEGRTPFHRQQVQQDLIYFWPLINQNQPRKVFVPLCGKTLDMHWLAEQGLAVTGIDLSIIAIESFIQEQGLTLNHKKIKGIDCFQNPEYNLLVGNIFNLDDSLITHQDVMYDRAALIALPEKLRKTYVDCCLKWLKPGATILLKTIHYKQELMEGPPYAVGSNEVYQLFQHCQSIQPLMTRNRYLPENDSLYQRGLRFYQDQIWFIRV